uniref:EGF-like domain-containing protein n=1 Tax=Ditylenchus dipsaci TaxID=166011 RepID=A0A915DYI3_9BILA
MHNFFDFFVLAPLLFVITALDSNNLNCFNDGQWVAKSKLQKSEGKCVCSHNYTGKLCEIESTVWAIKGTTITVAFFVSLIGQVQTVSVLNVAYLVPLDLDQQNVTVLSRFPVDFVMNFKPKIGCASVSPIDWLQTVD